MSSITNGERITDMSMPVTWAVLAGLLELVVVLGGVFVFAGDLRARVEGLEGYRTTHNVETVRRVEFEKLDASAVHKEEFALVKDQLNRLETKVDELLKRR